MPVSHKDSFRETQFQKDIYFKKKTVDQLLSTGCMESALLKEVNIS